MIRAFLAFLESRGAGEAPAGEVREALAADGPEGRAALVAEGILRTGAPATTHPCEGIDCAREVREAKRAQDGTRRYLAVCTRRPRACETVQLGEADVVQEEIVLSALVAAVRRALRIEPPLGAAENEETRARDVRLGGVEEPSLLGEQIVDGAARDVFFVRRPSAPSLRALLAERRAAARGTLVLVPTARGIDPELLARHGAGHVEIAALTDRLVVDKGRLALPRRLRVVPTSEVARVERADGGPSRRSGLGRLPRAKRWNEVAFFLVDDEAAIGVEIDGRSRTLTAAELGLTDRRGEPVRAFRLLRRICEGMGLFDTRPWGSRENGKQVVSELRRGLSAAFEIAESPIETYSFRAKSWKTRFRAFAARPSEVRAMERALGSSPEAPRKKRP